MVQKRFDPLDGLRLYAALLVVGSHTNAFHLEGAGGIMVSLFLTLSGFVAVRPLAQKSDEKRFQKPANWLTFYLQRAVRILPVYWLTICIAFKTGLMGDVGPECLRDNLLMTNVSGHLWYIQNQAVIYLFEPLLLLLSCYIKKVRNSNFFCGCSFFVLSFGIDLYFRNYSGFCLMGNGKRQYLRLGLFVLGMAFGFFAKAAKDYRFDAMWKKLLADLAELSLLAAGIFAAPFYLSKWGILPPSVSVGWHYPMGCAFFSGILFLLLLVNRDGITAKLLSFPVFRELGRASFGIYLVHFFFLSSLKGAGPAKEWLLICLISTGIAYTSYNLFEKPLYQFTSRFLRKQASTERSCIRTW